MITAITSCTPVGSYIIVEGHAGPKHSVYSIFNTATESFETDIVGANLIFYGDDINTIVYSFWSDVYAYDGAVIASCELAENEYISKLSFIDNNTQVQVTIEAENGSHTETVPLP